MRNLIKIMSFFLVLAIGFGACCKDDDGGRIDTTEEISCVEEIRIEEVFLAKIGCKYQFIEEIDTIKVEVTDIEDKRHYGFDCESSTGGHAVIDIEVNNNFNEELIWPGCGGANISNIYNYLLPTVEVETYQVRMVKLFPLSLYSDSLPQPLEDYEVMLVILKKD